MNAKEKARRLRTKHKLEGRVDVVAVAEMEGLEVDYRTFSDRQLDEVTVGRSIAVGDHLDEASRRWAIAHAIGHHVMHGSSVNQVWLRTCTLLPDKLEAEAETFAYCLLVDVDEAWHERLADVSAVAGYFGVPMDIVAVQGRLI